jgi:hypothetical protein
MEPTLEERQVKNSFLIKGISNKASEEWPHSGHFLVERRKIKI